MSDKTLPHLRPASEFHVGQRVRMSLYAYEQGLIRQGQVWRGKPMPTTGIVRGVGRSPYSILVQRTGRKTVDHYSAAFWEPVR